MTGKTVTQNPVYEQTWRLDGLTLQSFTGAAVGHRLYSPPFRACGFEWRLSLAPNGDAERNLGHVSVYCELLTKDATAQPAVTLAVGDIWTQTLGDTTWSTRTQRGSDATTVGPLNARIFAAAGRWRALSTCFLAFLA